MTHPVSSFRVRRVRLIAALVSVLAAGCAVEPVFVDTGGSPDTGVVPTDRPDRPGTEPGDEVPADAPPAASSPYMEPAVVSPGDHVLAFLVADGAADLSQAVALSLYGEPDVVIATWAVRDGDELAVSLEVAAGSPAGPLDVVVDLADGAVLRIPEGLTVQ